MLDHVEVDSYGSKSPLSAVAQASLKGPQLMILTLYDPGVSIVSSEGEKEGADSLLESGQTWTRVLALIFTGQ